MCAVLAAPLPATAADGDSFTVNAIRVGGTAQPTTFVVTGADEVQIGTGTGPAIPTDAAGNVALPKDVSHGGRTYSVTSIADNAFRGAVAITSTGLATNNVVTRIGDYAYANAFALLDTGLARNTTVLEVGQGAFASARALQNAALPSSLTEAPSIPFTSAVNLDSAYIPVAANLSGRIGLKESLPVFYRSSAEGWATPDSKTFADLARYGAQPSSLIPLSSVTVTGATVSAPAGTNPYHASTGLFAGTGVNARGENISEPEVVTVSARDTTSFSTWKVTGLTLTPQQLATPTLTFPMPSADVSITAVSDTRIITTVTPRCVAARGTLIVSVRNDGTQTASVRISTPYGAKSFGSVAAGKSVSATFSSRLRTQPSGSVEVTATANGRISTTTTAYAQLECATP